MNQLQRTHGKRSFDRRGVVDESLGQDMEQFRLGLTRTFGGAKELTTETAALVRLLVTVETCTRLATANMIASGFNSAAGQRAFGCLMNATDRWLRLHERLQAEAAKQPPIIDPIDAIVRAVEEANR